MYLNVLFIASYLLIVCVSIPLWWFAVGRKRSGGEVLSTRPTPPSPLGFVDVLVMFFLWFVAQLATAGLASPLLGVSLTTLSDATPPQMAWLSILAAATQLVATGLAIAFMLSRYRRLDVLGWYARHFSSDVMIGVKAFFMVIPTILLVQSLLTRLTPYNHTTLQMLSDNGTGLTIAAVWLSAGFVAPICEEVFFRGILQGWLHRLGDGSSATLDHKITGGWGDSELLLIQSNPPRSGNELHQPSGIPVAPRKSVWPILVTAALFGLSHLGQGPAPIPLFLFGLALGYIYRKTGSVVPCIVLHMLLNGFSLFWFTLNVLYGEPAPEQITGFLGLFVSL